MDSKDTEPLEATGEIQAMVNTTIINATTNTGKALQLPIAMPKNLSPLVTSSKRHSMNLTNSNHQLDVKKSPSKCHCSSTHQTKRSINSDINQCIHKESFSCDSISKSFVSTANETPKLLHTPVISLSKSETNIAVSNVEESRNQLAIFNVVSLNDLHENDSFFDRTMNDHSKMQCLVNSSDNNLHESSPKKHNVTLTSPKVLTTVTVSMRNTVDVSDKVF